MAGGSGHFQIQPGKVLGQVQLLPSLEILRKFHLQIGGIQGDLAATRGSILQTNIAQINAGRLIQMQKTTGDCDRLMVVGVQPR